MCCRTWKNYQLWQKLWEYDENLAIFIVILMAAFGTKNVHSALIIQTWQSAYSAPSHRVRAGTVSPSADFKFKKATCDILTVSCG